MRISAEAAEGRVGVGGRCGRVRRTDGEHIDWRSSIAPWASGPAPKRRRRGSISPRATPDAPRASTGSNNNTFPRVIQKLIHSAPHHGGDVGSGRSPADALRHPRRRPHHLHHRGHQTRVPSEGASLPSDPIRAPPMDTRSPPRSSAPYGMITVAPLPSASAGAHHASGQERRRGRGVRQGQARVGCPLRPGRSQRVRRTAGIQTRRRRDKRAPGPERPAERGRVLHGG